MPQHDLVVIGAGPGGYVAAIRAAQLGLDVACVEKASALGGTCLRIGCIPSKALLESSELYAEASALGKRGIVLSGVELDLGKMMQHKSRVVSALTGGIGSLFKSNQIQHYSGHARLAGDGRVIVQGGDDSNEENENGGETELKAKHIIIATGSQPATLPDIELDGDRIGTSTEALAYSEVPEHLVVVGAGYIGLELGTVWRRLGAKVTVLEFLDRIMPGSDAEMAAAAKKLFEKQGIKFRLESRVTGIKKVKSQCEVEIDESDTIKCDRVLVAVGRRPNTEQLGLDTIGVSLDDRGYIPVDDDYATSVEGVYAIGDVIGGAMLAHKAEEEGVACVEKIVHGYGHVNYDAIPSVMYTDPELASVGKTEEALQEADVDYRKGTFPFIANGRARAVGKTDGMVKVLADRRTDRVLGVHILGPHAGELIAEATAAIEFGASSEDLARCCHAHPTLAEAIKEAALAVDDRALHFHD